MTEIYQCGCGKTIYHEPPCSRCWKPGFNAVRHYYLFTQGSAITGQIGGLVSTAILINIQADRGRYTAGHGKLCVAVFTVLFVVGTWLVGRLLDSDSVSFFHRLNQEHAKRSPDIQRIKEQTAHSDKNNGVLEHGANYKHSV